MHIQIHYMSHLGNIKCNLIHIPKIINRGILLSVYNGRLKINLRGRLNALRSITIENKDKGSCVFFIFFSMLFNKKFVSIATSFFFAATAASVDAYQFSPQVALQNARYESQGFRILSSEHVDNYSIRIKQPKSCEDGVQVRCVSHHAPHFIQCSPLSCLVLWLHWQAWYQWSLFLLLFRVKNRPWKRPYRVVVEWRTWLLFHDGIVDGIGVSCRVVSSSSVYSSCSHVPFNSPCQVNEHGNGTIRNPYSWNTAANVVFLDQVCIPICAYLMWYLHQTLSTSF